MLALLAAAILPQTSALPIPNPRVLVFSKTKGFRHDSIETATQALKTESAKRGYTITATEDASVFTEEKLKNFDVIAFLMTTGDVLDETQQLAMQKFVESGKGWVGVHSASDTEYDWPWYANLVGAYFKSHPPGGQKLKVNVENRGHLSTWDLPMNWVRADEWYDWRSNPRGGVTVLTSINEAEYKKGTPQDHPISWSHTVGKGRSWYTEMGHFKEAYSEPALLNHISGGIMWAAQGMRPEGSSDVKWKSAKGWRPVEGGLENDANSNLPLVGTQQHGDAHIHAEFKIPKGSNSGVYVQGRYEIQILDSWGTAQGALKYSDCGGVYQCFDSKTKTSSGGTPPRVNAFAGPGEWNTYDIVFRAPRFKGSKKIQDALFVEVRLNGVVIHENISVTGPTASAMFSNEKATGPLMLQGDHGPVAYRNVWFKTLKL